MKYCTSPKSSSSTPFLPCSVSSVPIFCAFSNPLMLWQPKQPYLAISSFPCAASVCCWRADVFCSGYFWSLFSVSRYAVTFAASASLSRRSGIFVSGHIALGFFTQE